MTFDEIAQQATQLAEEAVAAASEVRADAIGLDPRAGGRLYVGEGWIGVVKSRDRSLQYYGGFEYVDEEHRMEVGDYVFYSAEGERVAGHIAKLEEE